jgi:hypothetical protein
MVMNKRSLSSCLLVIPCLLISISVSAQKRARPRPAERPDVVTIGVGSNGSVGLVDLPAKPADDAAFRPVLGPEVAPLQPSAGLTITATFDSSITSDPNAANIEAAINNAIAIYQIKFKDPITVNVLFRYATTNPDGSPMDPSTLARSLWPFYTIQWNTFISALVADAKTANDSTANASLPTSAQTVSILPTSANGRAIGLNTPPVLFANGTAGVGGPYDGIVTMNSANTFAFTRPPSANAYDAQRAIEHELDEVLGTGSALDLSTQANWRPFDLFSYSAPGVRNLTGSGSRYFSINGGNTNIVGFNQSLNGDRGDWLSGPCPQTTAPFVQNAFACPGEYADVSQTTPEGVAMDVIGFDLNTAITTVAVAGRVTASDRSGIANARVTLTRPGGVTRVALTNGFGYYNFDGVETGVTYVVAAAAKRHSFTSRTITITDNTAVLDFIAP